MSSMTFTPLAVLPGWEATEGNFVLCRCGGLRFLRHVRKIGSRHAYPIVRETPRGFDLLIEDSAAHYADAATRAAA